MFEVQMEKDECLETCEADEKEAEAFQKIRSWSRNRDAAPGEELKAADV